MPEPRKRSRGCLWALVAILALVVIAGAGLITAGVLFGKSCGFIKHNQVSWGADEFPDFDEVWSCGSGEIKTVVIPIRGFISLDEGSDILGTPVASPSQLALMAIRRATHDPEVRALILDVDSGGGGITASDILYQALMNFRAEDEERVIVAIFGDVAASGAYYLALAADHIVARPTTITGSIGVLMQTLNVRELGNRIGVHDVTIKSGANKDLLNPLQEVSPEQRALLQGIVDSLYTRFVELVSERRELPEADVRAIADGRIITAVQAVDAGLVDEIGYWEDAQAATAELLGTHDIKVYRYEERFSISTFLRAFQGLSPAAWSEQLGRVRLLYQWRL